MFKALPFLHRATFVAFLFQYFHQNEKHICVFLTAKALSYSTYYMVEFAPEHVKMPSVRAGSFPEALE